MGRKEYDSCQICIRSLYTYYTFWVLNITNTDSTSVHQLNHTTLYLKFIVYVDLNRAAWNAVLSFTPRHSQSETVWMSELHGYIIFTTDEIVISCRSILVRALCIWPRNVRNHVTDHVNAALVRARHNRATIISTTTIRNYLRAYFHNQNYQRQC